jgi:ribosomal protein S12 methylthiotransferase accessory factor
MTVTRSRARWSAYVQSTACGFRAGIVPPWQAIELTFADLEDVHNVFIVGDTPSTKEASSGGVGRSLEAARSAAIGEALERYCASAARFRLARGRDLGGLPDARVLTRDDCALFSREQLASPGFLWPDVSKAEALYAEVFSAIDNRPCWYPEELVGLGSRVGPATLPSTSTGLAAHSGWAGWARALHGAVEELLERDALASYWLNGLPGREIALPDSYVAPVVARGGSVRCFDLTQGWNPEPVLAVCGQLPLRGVPRISFGIACRATAQRALEKAYLEWQQGVVFCGYYFHDHPATRLDSPRDVRDFIDHGLYYSLHPEAWESVPLLRAVAPPALLPGAAPSAIPAEGDGVRGLHRLLTALAGQAIRIFYRDLTLPDVADVGVTVVRAVSPDLSLLHADERCPFLGGRTRDVAWRYPDLARYAMHAPNALPHPLG